MEIDMPWELGDESDQPAGTAVIVVDTNILLRYLPLLRAYVNLIETCGIVTADQPTPTLCVPHVVLTELDGLKKSQRNAEAFLPVASGYTKHEEPARRQQSTIGNLSRAASNWLLDVLPSVGKQSAPHASVRGQRRHETLIPRENGRSVTQSNDMQILDCCLYFKRNLDPSVRVLLLSDDRNLAIHARFEEVDVVQLDERVTPFSLLERLDPEFAAQVGHNTAPTAPSASLSNRRATPSPPIRTGPSPKPIPLSREPDLMELELDFPPPPLTPLPPPTPRLVSTPSDVFLNLCELIAHFLALPLYRYILGHLRISPLDSRTMSRYLEELTDWRSWSAFHVVTIARRFWEDGGVRKLCFDHVADKGVPAAPPPPLSHPRPPLPPTRATSSSRWATGSHSRSQSLPVPSRASPSNSPPDTIGKRISSLHSSLSILAAQLSTSPSEIERWSAPRFSIFLELVAELLSGLLGGLYGGDVEGEVRKMVGKWAEELAVVGVGGVDVRLHA